jgi:hypothetical protein
MAGKVLICRYLEQEWGDLDDFFLDLCDFTRAAFEVNLTAKIIDLEGLFQGHLAGKMQRYRYLEYEVSDLHEPVCSHFVLTTAVFSGHRATPGATNCAVYSGVYH